MRKIIIQPANEIGFYKVILLERKGFYFFKWWKEVSSTEHEEETAFLKFNELIKKYNLASADIYDWSGDGLDTSMRNAS